MQIEAPGATDKRWLAFRSRLWSDGSEAEHLRYMADAIARGHFVRLAIAANGSAIGFVHASRFLRGCMSSPLPGVTAWRVRWLPRSRLGQLLQVAPRWRPIRRLRTQ